MAIKGAAFASFPDGQTVFGVGTGNVLQPLPVPDGYKPAPASTTTKMGATGAIGDLLGKVIIIPATTSPGAVQIQDGNGTAITIFTGGATSVADLKPIVVDLAGIRATVATTPGWNIICGAAVSALGTGVFT